MRCATLVSSIVIRIAGTLLALGPGCVLADSISTAGQAPYERCAYCHELDGNPRMTGFPRLAGQKVEYLLKQLHDFRAGRRVGTMQATAELLSDAEIEVVSRYFNAQSPSAPVTASVSSSAARAEQQVAGQLHRAGDSIRGIPSCSSCHGANAEGRDDFPRLAGQHAAYLETQLLDFKRGVRVNDRNGVMRNIVAAMTEYEIAALARYFTGLDPRLSATDAEKDARTTGAKTVK